MKGNNKPKKQAKRKSRTMRAGAMALLCVAGVGSLLGMAAFNRGVKPNRDMQWYVREGALEVAAPALGEGYASAEEASEFVLPEEGLRQLPTVEPVETLEPVAESAADARPEEGFTPQDVGAEDDEAADPAEFNEDLMEDADEAEPVEDEPEEEVPAGEVTIKISAAGDCTFEGEAGHFVRTANRRDFSVDPTGKTMLDVLKAGGWDTLAVGKIEDIFNHRGITLSNHAAGNPACIDATIEFLKKDRWKGLMFVNLVDTDMQFGHRRDVPGFARCLEQFDQKLPEIMRLLGEDGLLIITADHGCDPSYTQHTDHTRERVPLMVWGLGVAEGVNLGERKSFADVSATVLEALGCNEKLDGESFYREIALD